MATDKTYNGWTNYETWNVNLWMGNEQGSYNWYSQLAQEAWDAAEEEKHWAREEIAATALADTIKAEYEEAMSEMLEQTGKTASVWADLLGATLSEVNWREIATHLIDDVDKSDDEDEPEEA